MMKISEKNMLPSKHNKKQATNQRAMKIDDVTEKKKIDKKFDVGLISECEDNESRRWWPLKFPGIYICILLL